MITGAHSIIYSTNAEADREFFRDVLKLMNVDVGEGWLIFGLPPAEVAVHPSDEDNLHEFYLMCDDVEAFAERLRERVASEGLKVASDSDATITDPVVGWQLGPVCTICPPSINTPFKPITTMWSVAARIARNPA